MIVHRQSVVRLLELRRVPPALVMPNVLGVAFFAVDGHSLEPLLVVREAGRRELTVTSIETITVPGIATIVFGLRPGDLRVDDVQGRHLLRS
jgi:hypothetical protein